MDFWQDQVVLVTGASRGIGRAIAKAFSEKGCKVAINYASNEAKAQEALAMCNPEKTKIYAADVGEESQVQDMIKQISEDLGPVSILVNNAGITRDGLLMTMKTEDWRAVMRTHLDAAFYCSRAVVRPMMKKKRGRIINISSVSGVKGTPGQCNYSAAKAGMIGLTKSIAREMGKKNITCNALALGVVQTEMVEALNTDVLDAYKESTAVQRIGKPEEVAGLCLYLASEAADYITGQTIVMDGGMI